jgi:hypothetical protein
MLKMPYIHYIDVKSNEQSQQEITGLTSLQVTGTSLACLIMICSLVDVTHKEHKWRNGFFLCLEKEPQLNIQTMCSRIFGGKTTTVHYELEWLASVLVLCSRSSQEMLPLQWSEGEAPSPQAFITSSSLYKRRIWFPSTPQRGRCF